MGNIVRQRTAPTIKLEQKKSALLREISAMVHALSDTEPALRRVFVSRVDLSADGGICYVFLGASEERVAFDLALDVLKLYKGSLRKSLAQRLEGRYVPDIRFLYDESLERQRRMDALLDALKEQDKVPPKD